MDRLFLTLRNEEVIVALWAGGKGWWGRRRDLNSIDLSCWGLLVGWNELSGCFHELTGLSGRLRELMKDSPKPPDFGGHTLEYFGHEKALQRGAHCSGSLFRKPGRQNIDELRLPLPG